MLSLSNAWGRFRKPIASRSSKKPRRKQGKTASTRRSPRFEGLEDRMLLTTVFSDGFESAFPGSWTVSSTGATTTARWGDNQAKVAGGSRSAFCADNGSNLRATYDNNLTTTMQRQGVSLASYNTATLGFKMWLNTESSLDVFQVKVRDQRGTWSTVYTASGNQSAAGWQTKSVNLDAFAGQGNLTVSFGFTSNGTVIPRSPAGVWIDDVNLTAQTTEDAYEDNDTIAVTAARTEWEASSPNLGLLRSPRVISGLRMADSADCYRFRTGGAGASSDFVRIDFIHSQGDLDMALYDASGTLIRSSNGVGSGEQISLNGLAAGAYDVRIYGRQGAASPNYTLTIDPPSAAPMNFAVLFSGGVDAANNHVRYYDNIRNLYTTITTQCNVRPENVYVVFADGTDPAVDRSDGKNSDMSYASAAHVLSATRANTFNTLTTLAGTVTTQDNFFFYSFDHGDGNHPDPNYLKGYAANAPSITGEEVLNGWGEDIGDHELAPRLRAIDAAHSTYVFAECFSGGMLDDLMPMASNNFGCAATNHYEFSWGDGYAGAFVAGLNAGYRYTQDVHNYARTHDPYLAGDVYVKNGGTYISGKEHPWSTGSNFPIFIAANGAANTLLVSAGLPKPAVPNSAGQEKALDAAVAEGAARLIASDLATACGRPLRRASVRPADVACDAALLEMIDAPTGDDGAAARGDLPTVASAPRTGLALLGPAQPRFADLDLGAHEHRDLVWELEEPWTGWMSNLLSLLRR